MTRTPKNRNKRAFRLWTVFSFTLVCTLLLTSLASAHVTVKPSASAPGAWETYTIKIPTEKDIPTLKVTLKLPSGTELEQYQPADGWKTTVEKDSSGKATSMTWETEGTGIEPGQFQQFNFVAKNPTAEGPIAWDAFQYYQDGTVVEWTGGEGTDTPHSITQISSAPAGAAQAAGDESHDATASGNSTGSAANTSSSSGISTLGIVNLVISILALIAALAALWFAVLNGRRNKA